MDNNVIIPMGKIIGAFGILGWVKIKTDTVLEHYPELLLSINDKWVAYKIEKAFVHDAVNNVKLLGVDNRDQAFALRGTIVGIERDKFPDLEQDEYYQTDLIGLTVHNKEHQLLGIVDSLMETGANVVLVLKDGDTERLIPFVNNYIISVDLPKKQIIADWGLDY